MNTNVLFLTIGKNGMYVRLKPDFENGRFVTTVDELNAQQFHSFGFCKQLSGGTLNYTDDTKETIEKMRLNAFRELCNTLEKKSSDLGFNNAIILIEVVRDQDTGHYWSLIINYQFVVR